MYDFITDNSLLIKQQYYPHLMNYCVIWLFYTDNASNHVEALTRTYIYIIDDLYVHVKYLIRFYTPF